MDMKNPVQRLRMDCAGASAAEYALLLAILGGSVAIGAWMLGGSAAGAMSNSAQLIAYYSGGSASS